MIKPDEAVHHNNKGLTLYNLEQLKDAIDCFDEAIRLQPDNVIFYNNKGNALNLLGKPQEAIQLHDQAIKLNSQEDSFYQDKATTLENFSIFKQALICSRIAIDLDPNSIEPETIIEYTVKL